MVRATRWLTLALVAFAFSTALRADDAKVEGDLKKLQGTWVKDGGEGPDSTWVFEGSTLKATVNGDEYKCAIKLDPKASPHPTLDIEVKEGPADSPGKTAKAIYKFEGERTILTIAMPGVDTRPTEFKTVEGESFLFELKKEK